MLLESDEPDFETFILLAYTRVDNCQTLRVLFNMGMQNVLYCSGHKYFPLLQKALFIFLSRFIRAFVVPC